MSHKDTIDNMFKKEIKRLKLKVLVDKNVGGDVLKILYKAFPNSKFTHIGKTELSDASDREIVKYAIDNDFDAIVTMDYGLARLATLSGIAVLLIFTEDHKRFIVTYIMKLGEIKYKIMSNL